VKLHLYVSVWLLTSQNESYAYRCTLLVIYICMYVCCVHINIRDREIDEKTGFRTKCVLCVPVNDHSGNVLAVVQAVNKQVCVCV
jgi:hypothetical protein